MRSHPWPVLNSLRGWTWPDLSHDLAAGLTLAAITIPEQMATARLGSFAPQIGFLAFIAGSLAFALFGASRCLSAGADSTITPIFAGSLAILAAAGSSEYAHFASVLALLVGTILILGSFLRLGWIADLLSVPVVTGFLAGISIHIVLSQAPVILGLPSEEEGVYQRIATLVTHLGATNPFSAAIGLGVFVVTFACERLNPRIPAALLGLVCATLAVLAFNLEGQGVAVLGEVAPALPHLSLPALDLQIVTRLLTLAVVIALIVMMQTAATTRSFPDHGELPDVDRDFLGVGAGNVLAGLMGAFPVNASPPRTAIVAETGGRSQIAGLFAAGLIIVLIVFGAKLLAHIPNAALAGVLLYVAQRIFRVRAFVAIYRRTVWEFGLILVTMLAIVLLPIQTGVTIGIFLSLLHGVFTLTHAHPIEFERVTGTTVWWPPSEMIASEKQDGVLVMAFQAPLVFLNAHRFRHGILDAIADQKRPIHVVIFEASSIIEIDYTASEILSDVIRRFRANGIDFAVARLESVRAQEAFKRFGLVELLGSDHIFRSVAEAVQSLRLG